MLFTSRLRRRRFRGRPLGMPSSWLPSRYSACSFFRSLNVSSIMVRPLVHTRSLGPIFIGTQLHRMSISVRFSRPWKEEAFSSGMWLIVSVRLVAFPGMPLGMDVRLFSVQSTMTALPLLAKLTLHGRVLGYHRMDVDASRLRGLRLGM